MHVFIVARYGNNQDGPNGTDTLFLVRAENHVAAANLVDSALREQPSLLVAPACNWICELGVDGSGRQPGEIIKGPFYDLAGACGCVNVWTRDVAEEPWVLTSARAQEPEKPGKAGKGQA